LASGPVCGLWTIEFGAANEEQAGSIVVTIDSAHVLAAQRPAEDRQSEEAAARLYRPDPVLVSANRS
jgi:hypothetical protein